MNYQKQNEVMEVSEAQIKNNIIYERDAPKLSYETGLPISRCIFALKNADSYDEAKSYLQNLDTLILNNIEGD